MAKLSHYKSIIFSRKRLDEENSKSTAIEERLKMVKSCLHELTNPENGIIVELMWIQCFHGSEHRDLPRFIDLKSKFDGNVYHINDEIDNCLINLEVLRRATALCLNLDWKTMATLARPLIIAGQSVVEAITAVLPLLNHHLATDTIGDLVTLITAVANDIGNVNKTSEIENSLKKTERTTDYMISSFIYYKWELQCHLKILPSN